MSRAPQPPPATRIHAVTTRTILPWLAPLVFFAPLLWRLGRMWRSEPEQYFGFAVPALVAWLLWRRRAEWAVPAAAPATRLAWTLAIPGFGALALGLLALESNPLWPTAAWLASLGAIALSLGAIAHAHGARGAKNAALVLVLFLTALKWPAAVHGPVMHGLMRVNAAVAAELASLAGAPAMVNANVIETARGWVGVDEACSGLRSLQTVVMMALLLGEFARFNLGRRALLLVGAVASALVFNIARTATLTWVFARRGPEVEERWHDPAGLVALALTLAAVWLLSERLPGSVAPAPSSPPDAEKPAPPSPRSLRPLVAGCVAMLVLEAGVQLWFVAHTPSERGRVSWRLEAPVGQDWREVELSRRAVDLLDYKEGEHLGRETLSPARQFLAFAFRWEADLARLGIPELHDPLICLPSVGAVLERELPPTRVEVEGVPITFRFVRFRQGATPQHVWFTLWSTRADADPARPIRGLDPVKERWARVRAGLRDDEREQLIFFVQGEPDDARAEALLRETALSLLRRN
jgi:Thiol:disulfide interchange protein